MLSALLSPIIAQGDDAVSRDAEQGRPERSTIAVIDVKQVLESYSAFQRRKSEIEAGIAMAEAAIKEQKERIDVLAKQLRTLQAGSVEHTELDLTIARQTAALREQVLRARQKCLAEQARAYAEAYQELVREVEKLLAESPYEIVLRINDTADEASVDDSTLSLLKQLNRTIVSSAPQADISREIQRRLNGGQQKAANRLRPLSRAKHH
jgi:Skp family chaperone for outer membrane proteins